MRNAVIMIGVNRGYVFLTRNNIADSIIGGMSFAVFMLLIALISPQLPITWGLSVVYFFAAFCFAFTLGILNYIVDNFLKAYFPGFHKRAAEFKKRYKKRRRF